MRFLILSDPHANWHALDASLADAEGLFDRIVCCGDLVGYNTRPAQVLEWIRANCTSVVRGNHDKVVAGIEDLEWFNEVAQSAAKWTVGQLTADQHDYLLSLPAGPLTVDDFQIFHGSPRNEDEYITNAAEAAGCFSFLDLPLAFFGHTHVQGGFFLKGGRVGTIPPVRRKDGERILEIEPDISYMINAGSIGQPRDGDPRAAYAIYDSGQQIVRLRRVEYPVRKTAEEIETAGLPDVLALRLFQGV